VVEDFDLYADEELYEDEEEEEEVAEGEGPNRTFIILVAALGGLLAVTVCIFVIWALVLNPKMAEDRVAQNQAIAATNEALLATAGMLTGTVTIEGAAPDTDVATDTPVPTDVPGPTDTATPRPATPGLPTPTPAEVAEANTPTPTATPRATPTPRPGKTGVPETGIGALGASVLAVGLLFLLIVVRRMRRAV
jgi:hypothetical protein